MPSAALNTWLKCEPRITYGIADDFSRDTAENPAQVHDIQAAAPRLFGIDHQRLTYRFQDRDFCLTDVHGKIVRDILA